MTPPTRPWPLLAVAAAALLVGAGSAWIKGNDAPLSFALAAAGMVVLGAWLTIEITRTVRRRDDDPE